MAELGLVRALVRDLRRAGALATSVAVCLSVVLIAGVVAAMVRTGGRDTSPRAAGTHGVPRGWVQVVDQMVGFTAWLPDPPTDHRLGGRAAGGLTVRLARDSHRIVIERIAIPSLSATDLTRVFRHAVDSLAFGAGFQVESETATSFRGQLAREGVYVTDSGTYYHALTFVDGAGDMYVIASPERYFKAITTTFQVLVPRSRPLGP